jgi:hypothetical protein
MPRIAASGKSLPQSGISNAIFFLALQSSADISQKHPPRIERFPLRTDSSGFERDLKMVRCSCFGNQYVMSFGTR